MNGMGDPRVLCSLWDRLAQAAILKTNGGGEIAAGSGNNVPNELLNAAGYSLSHLRDRHRGPLLISIEGRNLGFPRPL